PERAGGSRLEGLDVDLGVEQEQAVLRLDGGGAERTARDVHRLVEVVRRGGRVELGPESVHRLLTVQSVPAREGEGLAELACLAKAPAALRHLLSAGRHAEAAEQADPDLRHAPRMTYLASPSSPNEAIRDRPTDRTLPPWSYSNVGMRSRCSLSPTL